MRRFDKLSRRMLDEQIRLPYPLLCYIGFGDSGGLSPEVVQRCVTEGSRYLQCISFDYLITAAWMLGIALGFGLTRVGSPPRSPREVR